MNARSNFDRYWNDEIEGPSDFPTTGNDAKLNHRVDRAETPVAAHAETVEVRVPKHRAEVGEQTLSQKMLGSVALGRERKH